VKLLADLLVVDLRLQSREVVVRHVLLDVIRQVVLVIHLALDVVRAHEGNLLEVAAQFRIHDHAHEVAVLDGATAVHVREQEYPHHHGQDDHPDPPAGHHRSRTPPGLASWWRRTWGHGMSSTASLALCSPAGELPCSGHSVRIAKARKPDYGDATRP